jgi:hypothetical protein
VLQLSSSHHGHRYRCLSAAGKVPYLVGERVSHRVNHALVHLGPCACPIPQAHTTCTHPNAPCVCGGVGESVADVEPPRRGTPHPTQAQATLRTHMPCWWAVRAPPGPSRYISPLPSVSARSRAGKSLRRALGCSCTGPTATMAVGVVGMAVAVVGMAVGAASLGAGCGGKLRLSCAQCHSVSVPCRGITARK